MVGCSGSTRKEVMEVMKHVIAISLAATIVVLWLARTSAQPNFNPEDLQGTWQIMSIKNLKTGEVGRDRQTANDLVPGDEVALDVYLDGPRPEK